MRLWYGRKEHTDPIEERAGWVSAQDRVDTLWHGPCIAYVAPVQNYIAHELVSHRSRE